MSKEIMAVPAHQNREAIIALKNVIGRDFLTMGHLLWTNKKENYWRSLGHESFDEFIAEPEVGLSPSMVYGVMQVYETFILKLARPVDEVAQIDYTKLTAIVPVTNAENVRDWLDKAANLSRSDLRTEVAEAQGKAPKEWKEKTPEPEGLYDTIPPICSGASYVEGVKQSTCIVCGDGRTDPHHFPITKGAGCEAVSDWVIPLCRECHTEAHHDPKEWMWKYKAKWAWWFYVNIFTGKADDVVVAAPPIDVECEVIEEPALLPAVKEVVKKPRKKRVSSKVDTTDLSLSKFGDRV